LPNSSKRRLPWALLSVPVNNLIFRSLIRETFLFSIFASEQEKHSGSVFYFTEMRESVEPEIAASLKTHRSNVPLTVLNSRSPVYNKLTKPFQALQRFESFPPFRPSKVQSLHKTGQYLR
jgi:hypothetical protein